MDIFLKMKMKKLLSSVLILSVLLLTPLSFAASKGAPVEKKVQKTEIEWKDCLTPEAYEILRKKGTERAFTGKYYNNKEKGSYVCAGCGTVLFDSETKFDSGTGWPSFYQPANPKAVAEAHDKSHGMVRREVHCPVCGGHLGHVFEDGPAPTGLRYCINSGSLDFKKSK